MRGAGAILKKELLVLRRDLHGLMVLFVMPVAFILVMSLAMREEYAAHSQSRIEVWVLDADRSARAERMLEHVAAYAAYRLVSTPEGVGIEELRAALLEDRGQFLIHIPAHYFERFDDMLDAPLEASGEPIEVLAAPSVRRPMALLLEGAVKEAVARVRLDELVRDVREELAGPGVEFAEPVDEQPVPPDAIAFTHLYRGEAREVAPSAVQQNVPAWLVFSMFFVVIPLSTTFISERQYGTLARLRSMDVSVPLIFAGKLAPYVAVNLVQVVLMLAVGVHVVPLLGGDVLELGRSPAGLLCIALGVSVAALGFALLVSVVARTTEQATVLGGAGSILLGAIGGVMVPRFLMPDWMQTVSWISPMAWGLEGFLDVLLRSGGVRQVVPEALALVGFGGLALLLAAQLLRRRAD